MKKFLYILKRNFDIPLMLGALITTITGQFTLSIIIILGAIYLRVYSNHLSLQGLYNVLDVIALRVFNRNYDLEKQMVDAVNKQMVEGIKKPHNV